jgi:mannonate dehydratase
MIHPNVRSSIEMRLIFDGIHDVTDDQLKFSQQVGVEGIAVAAPELGDPDLGHYAFADLIALRTRIEAYGLNLEGIENSPWVWTYKWMLGLPGRDEQIENYQKTIRNLGAAGIPVITFNMHAMRFYRTAWSKAVRGGAGATAFDWELVKDAPLMTGGPSIDTSLIPQSHWRTIGDEEMWDNLTYFLKAVVPVAEEAGVKLGLHPDDPPIPSIGGVARIMRSPDAFRRAIEIVPSDNMGLLLCQGCFSEMGANIPEEIRYFGSRKKIFHVHFRNVAGTANNFNETFPDEGETDMVEAMKAYVEVGYDGTMAPDHVIRMAGDSAWGHRYWAYAIGHMKALKRAVEKLS